MYETIRPEPKPGNKIRSPTPYPENPAHTGFRAWLKAMKGKLHQAKDFLRPNEDDDGDKDSDDASTSTTKKKKKPSKKGKERAEEPRPWSWSGASSYKPMPSSYGTFGSYGYGPGPVFPCDPAFPYQAAVFPNNPFFPSMNDNCY